ncbi:50S ribosomal protein L6 [bacterium]|nr:50S ribosomal protein L6 [bacterium]
MSRIGKLPVPLPEGVKVNIQKGKLEFEGPKGKMTSPLLPGIKAEQQDNQILLKKEEDSAQLRSYQGLCRTLAFNAVTGITKGFSQQLEIVGVGYRAKLQDKKLELSLGYSRPIVYDIPEDIEIVVEKPTLITVKGKDKQRVGEVAQKIRSFRKPEPYKLKGIRYVGEHLIKKERKAGVGGV